jgi:7-cyano-7-deazaguanine synthase
MGADRKRGAIVLTSGGADSVPLLYHVAKVVRARQVVALHANYGQRMAELELLGVRKSVEHLISEGYPVELRIVDISWLGKLSTSKLVGTEPLPETPVEALQDPEAARKRILWWWDVVRNLQLVTIGLAFAESFDLASYLKTGKRDVYDVYIGIRRETPVPMKDNTREFVEEMNRVAEQATHFGGYRVLAPFIDLDKHAVITLGGELGVRWEFTFSCYTNLGLRARHPLTGEDLPLHCGQCSNCRRRAKAFVDAGVYDPTLYNFPPLGAVEYERVQPQGFIQRKRE